MSIIVEYSVSSPDLTLYDATTTVPEVDIEIIDVFAVEPERPVLFCSVPTDGAEEFQDAIEDDPTVGESSLYAELGDRSLYRAVVSDETPVVGYPVWVRAGAGLIESTCQDGVWRGTMRFPDREALQMVIEWCKDNDIALTVDALYTERDRRESPQNGLSEEQERTLEAAYEMGHFEVPQDATAEDLAERFDISQQSISERLRRGYATLVRQHVLDDDRE